MNSKDTTPSPSQSSNDLDAPNSLHPHVDETLSHLPFFAVYRYPDEPSLAASLARAANSAREVIIAKLFVSEVMMGIILLYIFTNQGVARIHLRTATLPKMFWRIVGTIEKIPVIGWVLAILLEPIHAIFDRLLKTELKRANRLISISDEAILELKNTKKGITKLAKGVTGSWVPYAQALREFQPSAGISIEHRRFSYLLSKIRVTIIRVIPLGPWFKIASAVGGGADYGLPDRAVIPKINSVIQAAAQTFPIEHFPSTPRQARFLWPESIGVGGRRWSMVGASFVSIFLLLVFAFFVYVGRTGTPEGFALAIPAGLGLVHSLIFGRTLGHAIFSLFITFLFVTSFAAEIGLFDG